MKLIVAVATGSKTTVLVPASTVPAVQVQLFLVAIIPDNVNVPEDLLMFKIGMLPPDPPPVNVWAPVPLMSNVAVPE